MFINLPFKACFKNMYLLFVFPRKKKCKGFFHNTNINSMVIHIKEIYTKKYYNKASLFPYAYFYFKLWNVIKNT